MTGAACCESPYGAPRQTSELYLAPPNRAGWLVATSDSRCRVGVSHIAQRLRRSVIERLPLSYHPTSPLGRDLGVHPRGEFRTIERPQANEMHGPRQRPSLSNAKDCPSSEGGHQGLPATPPRCTALWRCQVARAPRSGLTPERAWAKRYVDGLRVRPEDAAFLNSMACRGVRAASVNYPPAVNFRCNRRVRSLHACYKFRHLGLTSTSKWDRHWGVNSG